MSLLNRLLNSSLGQKLLMALTGLFLILFLAVHLTGNLQLLYSDDGYAFNKYARFMTTFPLIKIISYGNYFFILFHAFKGISLAIKNRSARQRGYAVNPGNATSAWASRNMGILGTVILVFLAVHMSDFWWKYHNSDTPWAIYETNLINGDVKVQKLDGKPEGVNDITTIVSENSEIFITKDLFQVVKFSFTSPILVLFYIIAMAAVAFHLLHGFASAFQTLGVNHPTYTPLIKNIGRAFAIIVPLAFAAIPLILFFNK